MHDWWGVDGPIITNNIICFFMLLHSCLNTAVNIANPILSLA